MQKNFVLNNGGVMFGLQNANDMTRTTQKNQTASQKTTITEDDRKKSGWVKGTHDNFTFCAKVYDDPSDFGIDNGRTSKLEIKDLSGKTVVNYDRGWDIKASTLGQIQAVSDIVTFLNKLPNA